MLIRNNIAFDAVLIRKQTVSNITATINMHRNVELFQITVEFIEVKFKKY